MDELGVEVMDSDVFSGSFFWGATTPLVVVVLVYIGYMVATGKITSGRAFELDKKIYKCEVLHEQK